MTTQWKVYDTKYQKENGLILNVTYLEFIEITNI